MNMILRRRILPNICCRRSKRLPWLFIHLGITCSIIIVFILFMFSYGYRYNCRKYFYNLIRQDHLSIIHSNIITSVASISKLEKLNNNCLSHPDRMQMPMDILMNSFDDIYESPCILHPPLLVPTLDFYIGSYSVSLRLERLHLTFIDCFHGRECFGSYKDVLEQQAFPINLIKIYSQNESNIIKSRFQRHDRHYACLFQWHSGQNISRLHIVKTQMGGSGYCKFSKELLRAAMEPLFSLKVLIVLQNKSNNSYVLCKIYSNLFDLNVPSSYRNISSSTPFQLSLACAPLTWSQIRKNIILEWIIYHRIIGVEHFLIYLKENNHSNVQRIIEYFQPFLDDHTVTLIHWQFGALRETRNAFQIPQMIDAVQRTADFSVWTMISDTDEFFYAEHYDTLIEILENYRESVEYNLTATFRQELLIQNVHMMNSLRQSNSPFITEKYISRYKTTGHPVRSKIIAYSGGDRFLAAEEVHYFSTDSTFVPEQLIRMNHYFNAYNESRKPTEIVYYINEDTSLWDRFGEQIRQSFEEYIHTRRVLHKFRSSDCFKYT